MSRFELEFSCNEKWDEMAIAGRGKRHCAFCDHAVVDISRMTEAEVGRLYEGSGGKLCARGWFVKRDGRFQLAPMPTTKRRLSVLQPSVLAASVVLAACDGGAPEDPRVVADAGLDGDTDDAGATADTAHDVADKHAQRTGEIVSRTSQQYAAATKPRSAQYDAPSRPPRGLEATDGPIPDAMPLLERTAGELRFQAEQVARRADAVLANDHPPQLMMGAMVAPPPEAPAAPTRRVGKVRHDSESESGPMVGPDGRMIWTF